MRTTSKRIQLIILCQIILLIQSASGIEFKQIDVKNGLSSCKIKTIYQDKTGFIWIGTESGINKYDAYDITSYLFNPKDETSVMGNSCNFFYEDRGGQLWIGSEMGMSAYDKETNSFTRYYLFDLDDKQINVDAYGFYKDKQNKYLLLSNDYLYIFDDIIKDKTNHNGFRCTETNSFAIKKGRSFTEDNNGILWISTEGNGLILFDRKSNTILTDTIKYPIITQISDPYLKSVFIDSIGSKWISSKSQGIYLANKENRLIQHYQETEENGYCSSNEGYAINKTTNGDIWYANSTEIKKISTRTNKIKSFPVTSSNELFKNIRCVYPDNFGNIWIGTSSNGVFLFLPTDFSNNITTISSNTKPFKLNNPSVLSIYRHFDNLLVGTDWGGLNIFNLKTMKSTNLTHSASNPNSIGSDAVTTIFKDSKDQFWLGFYSGGLCKFNVNTFKSTNYKDDKSNPQSISFNDVVNIYEDKELNLWISTNGGGLNLYNQKTKTFKAFKENKKTNGTAISTNNVLQVFEDSNGKIWIATYYGLNVINQDRNSFKYYFTDFSSPRSISHNWVYCIAEDLNSDIWIGTANGLNKYNKKTDDFTIYRMEQGLPGNVIFGIITDDKGYLWLSTNNGISCFNPKSEVIKNFNISDRSIVNEFNPRSFFKSKDGEIYFGGITGLCYFNPDSLIMYNENLRVSFTSIKYLNKIDSKLEGELHFNANLNETRNLKLNHDQTNISIEFSAFNYFKPERVKYAYKMEGIDTNWVFIGTNRSLSFPKIEPGNYTLSVKAYTNNNWSKAMPSVITITVNPPLYLTLTAKLFYLIIVILTIYLYQRHRHANTLIKTRLMIAELEREKTEIIYNEKISFFSNISHELKTPLTIILGYAEKWSEKNEQDKNLIILKRNTKKLKQRIEQLLDFQKMDSGMMMLNVQKIDIIDFIRHIIKDFSYEALNNTIKFSYVSNKEFSNILFDTEKVEKIITNLLSNAFKFTPVGGEITVTLTINDNEKATKLGNEISIEIKDSGIGISKEDLPLIFDRFFSKPGFSSTKGTGIGLALTRELAKIHNGDIHAVSTLGIGSTFTFSFKAEVELEDIAYPKKSMSYIEIINEPSDIEPKENKKKNIQFSKEKTILIADDQEDIKQYIADIFQNDFNIITASDGKNALDLAIQHQPDIIITDILMPVMNGLEFCHKLKTNILISHIPIILVTALHSEQKHIEGLEYGADDYLDKPFNSRILELKVKNIIARTEHWGNIIKKDENIIAEKITTNPTDRKFMEKLIAFIEANAVKSDFGIQEIVEEMAMSKSVFYRKVKSITNQSIMELVRTVRLKQAANLLKTTNLTINEVAYEVGYSDAGYFIRTFKEYYNCTPGEFTKTNTANE